MTVLGPKSILKRLLIQSSTKNSKQHRPGGMTDPGQDGVRWLP